MGVPFFARRFVAGHTLEDGLSRTAELNAANIHVSLDALGENVADTGAIRLNAVAYSQVLEAIAVRRLSAHISVKLTMLGLDVSPELCTEVMHEICTTADRLALRVNIDMEGSDYTESILRVYENLARNHHSVEIVLQASLHRTREDIERVIAARGRLRLCKGAYKENAQTALLGADVIRERYLELVTDLLHRARHVNIATHDDTIIKACERQIAEEHVPRERYEFQMLYGMREPTWHVLAQKHPMTVYVPYGTQWFAYYSRRLLERKENVWFVIKNAFRR